MSVDFLYSSIRPLEYRQAVEQAVIAAVGNRSDRWKVWLSQGDGKRGFSIRLHGPDGAGFSYRFLKRDECSPEFVREKIQRQLHPFNGTQAS